MRGTSAADKSMGAAVPPAAHRGSRLRASPHRESGPLLKCSWKRDAPFRRPDAHAEGARNTPVVIGDPSRLALASKQNFPQCQWTGLCVLISILSF